MSKTAISSLRLPEQAEELLATLAEVTGRPAAEIASEAIADYAAAHAWQIEATRRAVAKADAGGPFVRHDDAVRYLDALARGDVPEAPPAFRID
jgi:predicted transcriptional regulator